MAKNKAVDERAERLEVIRQNIAAQIQIKTKCMVRQKQSHELSQEKQLAVCL